MVSEIPTITRSIPIIASRLMVSPNTNQLIRAAIGGARVIISIAILDEIIGYEENRNKSPKTNPIIPERNNQSQDCIEASVGNIKPLLNQAKILRKTKPNNKRIRFTAHVPAFIVALSKARAETVQKTAVKSAANSPICDENIG